MKNILIILICIISPFISYGHNPLSASYHLVAGENASLITINLSQDGVNHLLLKTMNRTELEQLSSTEFEEIIVDYIKDNFGMSIDNNDIALGKGGIKLGSHQTDLKFVLPAIKNVNTIKLHIPAFKENENHQTIFSYVIDNKSDYLILNKENNFKSTLNLSTSFWSKIWPWIIGIGSMTILTLFVLHSNDNK